MRKPRRIALAKETLRDLEPERLQAGGAGTNLTCVGPDTVGQYTCARSNCASCTDP